jgi:hypothetical protein
MSEVTKAEIADIYYRYGYSMGYWQARSESHTEEYWRAHGKRALEFVGPALKQRFVEWIGANRWALKLYERDYMEAIRTFYREQV